MIARMHQVPTMLKKKTLSIIITTANFGVLVDSK